MSIAPGPIDTAPYPDRLPARALWPGPTPRLHGYDLHDDLACHYRHSEIVLLALRGEAPTEGEGRAFDVALAFACAAAIDEAPTHAGSLVQLCGARASAVLGVIGLGLAEQARVVVEERPSLVPWLQGQGEAPTRVPTPDDLASVERMRRALFARAVTVPALATPLDLWSAVLATFFFAGLRSADQLQAALCHARWPVAAAEAFTWTPGSRQAYPMRLPAFAYPGVTP